VDREHLAGNPGRDGNDVALNKRVVGGFVRQKTVEIDSAKYNSTASAAVAGQRNSGEFSRASFAPLPLGAAAADWRWTDCRS
jgi:hypothetical protein